MQGSSALQAMLDEVDVPVAVFAVWQPVSGGNPSPSPELLDRLTDPRVIELWDPDRLWSREMRAAELAHPPAIPQARLRTDESDDGVLYDTVAVFPIGARWEETLPGPIYLDGGLARVLPDLRRQLEDGSLSTR